MVSLINHNSIYSYKNINRYLLNLNKSYNEIAYVYIFSRNRERQKKKLISILFCTECKKRLNKYYRSNCKVRIERKEGIVGRQSCAQATYAGPLRHPRDNCNVTFAAAFLIWTNSKMISFY